MYVNLLKLNNTNQDARIYNLSNTPISAIEVYISCESSDIYKKLLGYGATISLDGTEFNITENNPGESSLNTIRFERPLGACKVKVYNSLNKHIGLIVGSDESSVGINWVNGINNRDLDDYITLSVNLSNITNQETLKYISLGTILVINPIYYRPDTNSPYVIIRDPSDNGITGWGEGGYGEGPYGGA